MMGVGFFLRGICWLTAEADQNLLHVCVNLQLPALIFESVLGNQVLRRPENLLLPPLLRACIEKEKGLRCYTEALEFFSSA